MQIYVFLRKMSGNRGGLNRDCTKWMVCALVFFNITHPTEPAHRRRSPSAILRHRKQQGIITVFLEVPFNRILVFLEVFEK